MTNTKYWKENLRYVLILLFFWFLFSFLFGIILKDFLNQFTVAGFKLGCWCAQEGSMYSFVLVGFMCVHLMNKRDEKYGFDN